MYIKALSMKFKLRSIVAELIVCILLLNDLVALGIAQLPDDKISSDNEDLETNSDSNRHCRISQ